MKVGILGYGREGKALLAFLAKDKAYKNAEFAVLDRDSEVKVPRGVSVQSGKNYLENLKDFDVIFRSPGVPYLLLELQQAKRAGVKISSATQLFFERSPATIIGVTGTKGKGTTATLLYRMLKTAKKDVYLAGNIGVPAITILKKLTRNSIVVLELSSFQLQDVTLSPHIALVLDLFPDHLDAHASLKEYYDAKSSIARYQTSRDSLFFARDNARTRRLARLGNAKKIPVLEREFRLFTPADMKLVGKHNFKNAVMAARVAENLKISKEIIKKVVKTFAGNEHRLEFVQETDGIRFYNDSASTTPESLAAAVKAFPDTVTVAIAGGKDKNLNYAPLLKALRSKEAAHVAAIVLFGENKKKIAQALRGSGVRVTEVDDLPSAVALSQNILQPFVVQGIACAVVLSPGSTSFDMFTSYAERGTKFKELVAKL